MCWATGTANFSTPSPCSQGEAQAWDTCLVCCSHGRHHYGKSNKSVRGQPQTYFTLKGRKVAWERPTVTYHTLLCWGRRCCWSPWSCTLFGPHCSSLTSVHSGWQRQKSLRIHKLQAQQSPSSLCPTAKRFKHTQPITRHTFARVKMYLREPRRVSTWRCAVSLISPWRQIKF